VKKIKVMFSPHPMASHLIPLICLAKKLDKSEFETTFLVPEIFHNHVESNGLNVINTNRLLEHGLMPEIKAASGFQPDVIVDDLNYYCAFSSRILKKPRVSIVRKGILPYEEHTRGYKHSSEVIEYFQGLAEINLAKHGMWQPKSVSDLFVGDVNIIPSIPSVDVLPDVIRGDERYVYSGPLLLDDEEMSGPMTYAEKMEAELDDFLDRCRDKKVVYFTIGIDDPTEILNKAQHCIVSMLRDETVAVVTNVSHAAEIDGALASRLFFSEFLPMNKVCSRIDLMVHHCGCGAYGYQLKYKVPGIVLGSKSYDRDDIAKQLDKCGAVHYLPAELDFDDFSQRFNMHVQQLLDASSTAYAAQKAAIMNLNDEIISVGTAFDFGKIIRDVVQPMTQVEVLI
jgi:UDP:flavonoid glycosyltransferase YjiC (YdhE family)